MESDLDDDVSSTLIESEPSDDFSAVETPLLNSSNGGYEIIQPSSSNSCYVSIAAVDNIDDEDYEADLHCLEPLISE